jgi:pilus assembly protein Flp/PilA
MLRSWPFFSVSQYRFKLGNRNMSSLYNSVRSLLRLKSNEEGATMVEYGLMVALIAVVCLVAVTALGTSIKGVFTSISTSV